MSTFRRLNHRRSVTVQRQLVMLALLVSFVAQAVWAAEQPANPLVPPPPALGSGLRPPLPEPTVPASAAGTNAKEDESLPLTPHVRTKSTYREYREALPGYKYSFPKDHGAHRDFKIEWWYYTGHLFAADGHPYGFEVTFFRYGSARERPREAFESTLTEEASTEMSDVAKIDTDYHAVHMAVSDVKANKFIYQERFNISGGDAAWASPSKLAVFQDGWTLTLNGQQHKIKAYDKSKDIGIDLTIVPVKPLVMHGKDGVTQLADCKGCASHYYSYTRMRTSGKLRLNGRNIPVTGTSYMEHQFGSHMFGSKEIGWDWFLAQLSDNREVMIYMMRQGDGRFDPHSGGTVVNKDGTYSHLNLSDFKVTPVDHWRSPTTEAVYPSSWLIDVPSLDLHFRLDTAMPNQELLVTGITYWEGKCSLVRLAKGASSQSRNKLMPEQKKPDPSATTAGEAADIAEQAVTIKRAGELCVITKRHPMTITLTRGDLYIPPYSGLVVRQNADGSALVYNFGSMALFTEVTASGAPKSWILPKATQLTVCNKKGRQPEQPESTRSAIGSLIETSGGVAVWNMDSAKTLNTLIKTRAKYPDVVSRLDELRRLALSKKK